ncbi:hypothetical protein QE370_001971 [Aeromicrobium sp. SORGH_AS981]|nr:hypothetical protein [Aeromicrobium sp. SORGH_AS_0981]
MSGPSSTASSSVTWMSADFDAPYMPMFGAGFSPATDDTLTMAPPCSAIHCR